MNGQPVHDAHAVDGSHQDANVARALEEDAKRWREYQAKLDQERAESEAAAKKKREDDWEEQRKKDEQDERERRAREAALAERPEFSRAKFEGILYAYRTSTGKREKANGSEIYADMVLSMEDRAVAVLIERAAEHAAMFEEELGDDLHRPKSD